MTNLALQVFQQAIRLSMVECAALVEGLIASLDKPDHSLDAMWLKEAEDRMNVYRAGDLATVDADGVFVKFGHGA